MEQKFTQMAQEALSDAVQNAAALGNPQVDTLHLLDAPGRVHRFMRKHPDLAERMKAGLPLNAPDPSTFYTPGAKGYTDYPQAEAATA